VLHQDSSPLMVSTCLIKNFFRWHKKYQLILAWLFSSNSALILAQVLNVETSQ
jgi:hypothetical protein